MPFAIWELGIEYVLVELHEEDGDTGLLPNSWLSSDSSTSDDDKREMVDVADGDGDGDGAGLSTSNVNPSEYTCMYKIKAEKQNKVHAGVSRLLKR